MNCKSSEGDNISLSPSNWTAEVIVEFTGRTVLSILTIVVNTLVLVAIWTTPSLRCPAHLVIGSLAVTDLLVGFMAGPMGLLLELGLFICPELCRLGYALMLTLCVVSINHLLFVSVDRFLLIATPLRYITLVTQKRAFVFIGLCWGYSMAVSFIFMFALEPEEPEKPFPECRAEVLFPLWFITYLTVLHFILPLIIMVVLYTAIFVMARRQQQAIKSSFRLNGVNAEGMSVGHRAKLRAARLLALPCGYFHLSWGPWFITILWAVANSRTVDPHYVERLVQAMAIFNSFGNPVLYAVSQPVLGRAMLAKLCGLCKKATLFGRKRNKCILETAALVCRQPTLTTSTV